MKKIIALVILGACVLGLSGCGQPKQVPPEVDLNTPVKGCWPGTITDMFTEGSGADLAEVIKLELKDRDPMNFTIIEDTVYLRYYSDTEKTEEITKEDLYVGAWVEIDSESYHNSGYHPIFTIKVIEPTENNTQAGSTSADEVFDIAVSYANWTEANEIYFGALNKDKMAISSVQHLPIYKFDTLQDFKQFKLTFAEVLTMDYGYDEVPSFNNVTAKYDNIFFEENSLILVYVGANSGTYRFGVNSVFCDGTSFCIHVEQTNNPEAVTDDMAGWFVTVAVPDSMVANCTEFDADLNNYFN